MDHNNHCISKALKIVGSKWTTLILYNLLTKQKRFGELQKEVEGISPRALSSRLKELESAGVISKKIFKEIPLHVEYTLTDKGRSLNAILEKMIEWGETN